MPDNNGGITSLGHPFPNVDAVQEFSVQTSSFDAQYGRGVGRIPQPGGGCPRAASWQAECSPGQRHG